MKVVIQSLVILALCDILTWTVAQASDGSSCLLADVGFVMDVSNHITKDNLRREKEIVQKLVKLFNVKLGGSRAGLMTFNDNATTLLGIGDKASASDFTQTVNRISLKGGRTYIDRALKEANDVLFGSKYVPFHTNRYLIIFTTGKQSATSSGNSVDLKSLTKSLIHFRVRIIVVGLPISNVNNLKEMVVNKQDMILIPSGSRDMDEKVNLTKNALCGQQPAFTSQCLKRIDLGFALDTSGSIGNRTYQKVKAFVSETLKHFTLSTTETHAAVIVYSTTPKLVIKLNEFYNLDIFARALSSRAPWKRPFVFSWMNGYTRIDLALTLAKNELFNSTNGDRLDVPNALIFLTDGKQKPAAPFPLEHYAQPLIKNKTLIIAVGFGRANATELRKIASAPQYVLSYNGTAEVLQNAIGDIVNHLCNYCTVNVNLGFVLDASRTTKNMFDEMQILVKHVAEGFNLKPGGTQASVVTFSDNAFVDIPFTSDLGYFKIEVDFLKSHEGRTFIDKGLKQAEKLFDQDAEIGWRNILIIVTDGKQTGQTSSSNPVKKVADHLRKKHFTTIAVSTKRTVLDSNDKKILRDLAGNDDNYLPWDKDILGKLVPEIIKKACPQSIRVKK